MLTRKFPACWNVFRKIALTLLLGLILLTGCDFGTYGNRLEQNLNPGDYAVEVEDDE